MKFKTHLILLFLSVFILSCSRKTTDTGWEYKGAEHGGFEVLWQYLLFLVVSIPIWYI